MPPIFYWHVDCILLRYNPLYTTSHFLPIHTNRLWEHFMGFLLARPCVIWHWFAFSHHDLNSCKLHFVFTSFDLIIMNMCCTYDLCIAISYSHDLLLGFFTMRHFPRARTLICLRLLFGFNLIVSLSHILIRQNVPTFTWRLIILFALFLDCFV